MFDSKSRYAAIETATYTDAGGRQVRYVRRRFLPQGSTQQTLTEVPVVQGDRLDLLAARTLGDPEQYWRICDANDAMNPFELYDEADDMVRVAVPQF